MYLLIEFNISEDGMHAPGLGEHGAKRKAEASHQQPSSRAADERKRACTRYTLNHQRTAKIIFI